MIKLPNLYCNEVQIVTEILVSIENLLKTDIDPLANIVITLVLFCFKKNKEIK